MSKDDGYKMKQNNDFKNCKFNGDTNIVSGNNNVINISMKSKDKENLHDIKAEYETKPIWRSPLTMDILTWIGTIIAIIDIVPFYKIIQPLYNLIRGHLIVSQEITNSALFGFIILTFLAVLFFRLRRIAKNETRQPLFWNYSLSGHGKRLSLEKIIAKPCPICGGEMKYYNKPIEWEYNLVNGETKREITKRCQGLECRRCTDHFFKIDPIESLSSEDD